VLKRLCMLILILVSAYGLRPSENCAAAERLIVSQPAWNGTLTGCRVTVEGHASLEPGEHVWVAVVEQPRR
jgi:hypothetical protein